MTTTSVLGSRSNGLSEPPHGPRDVAFIVGGDRPPSGELRVVGEHVAGTRGRVYVIRCVDDYGRQAAHDAIRRSRAARSELARVTSALVGAEPKTPVTERLHFGTVESLMKTLGDTVGMVIVSSTAEAVVPEIVSSATVPVCTVDGTRTVPTA